LRESADGFDSLGLALLSRTSRSAPCWNLRQEDPQFPRVYDCRTWRLPIHAAPFVERLWTNDVLLSARICSRVFLVQISWGLQTNGPVSSDAAAGLPASSVTASRQSRPGPGIRGTHMGVQGGTIVMHALRGDQGRCGSSAVGPRFSAAMRRLREALAYSQS